MSELQKLSGAASVFWDRHREKVNDPTFWMAHPACRYHINRRVSGSPHEWPLDWLKRVHVRTPLARGVSWGCGLGSFERAAIGLDLIREIDAFDVSPVSLADAEKQVTEAHRGRIHYRVGDFNDPRIGRATYDIAFFHASLHHVGALERLFRRLSFGLKPGGFIYVDEYVGPSRADWTAERLKRAQAVLDSLPEEAKLKGTLDLPIEQHDPSEAIRSREIPKFLRQFCDVIVWRPYGGQIVDLVLPYVRLDWANSPIGSRAVEEMLRIEDDELARDPDSTHHLVALMQLKPFPRLARPLGHQIVQGLKRRSAAFLRQGRSM